MLAVVFLLLILTLVSSEQIKNGIISGVRLSVFSVIPAIFPFMIFSDFLSCESKYLSTGFFARIFERVFNISSSALGAFLCGAVCGFPVGVSMATHLYSSHIISRDECERLIGFSSSPSVAFVISGVGAGLYGSVLYGAVIYLSIITASAITGFLFKGNMQKTEFSNDIPKQSFNLIASIKASANSCITVSAYIVFCSALIGLISSIIKNEYIITAATLLLEISNAAKALSLSEVPTVLKLSLTAFSLSFSGICVHMQARSLLPSDISMSRYYKMKLISGIVAFALSFAGFSMI